MPPFKFVAPVATAVLAGVVAVGALVPGAPAQAAPSTTVTSASCTYTADPDHKGFAQVSISVSWQGPDPVVVLTPLLIDGYNSWSAGFEPTRAERLANSATYQPQVPWQGGSMTAYVGTQTKQQVIDANNISSFGSITCTPA